MKLIDGKACSNYLLGELKPIIVHFEQTYKRKPSLKIVRISDDFASKVYTERKIKVASLIGIDAEIIILPEDIDFESARDVIQQFNDDDAVDGIIVQLPLPKHLLRNALLNTISPTKDVDGITMNSLGGLLSGASTFVPCTPQGILRLVKFIDLDVRGLNVVILGQSLIVGRPAAIVFLNQGATVTVCHSATRDLESKIKMADVLVSAMGNPNVIKPSWIKAESVVFDVSINRLDSGKIIGDVDQDACEHVGFITPVPGGVGPMTVAALQFNTVLAALRSKNDKGLLSALSKI